MSIRQNPNNPYRDFKVDNSLKGDKNASLGYTIQQIKSHCKKVTLKTPEHEANCINLNCVSQKYYIECYQVLRDRKQCIKNLKFEVEQNGLYRLSHLKID